MNRKYSEGILYLTAFAASFALTALPVLLFNYGNRYPMIFFLKWMAVFPVVAYGAGLCAFCLLIDRGALKVGLLEAGWMGLACLFLVQPFALSLRSFPEWVRNWYFFASLGGAVFLLRNLPVEKVLPAALRSVALTGALSTLFGFIQGAWPDVRIPFVLNIGTVPDRFLGNTGLDSILGAYLALAVVAGVWLLLRFAAGAPLDKKRLSCLVADLFFLSLNGLGLWKTASRSAFLSCLAGLAVLLCFMPGIRRAFRKILYGVCLMAVVYASVLFLAPDVFRVGRRNMEQLLTLEQFSPTREKRWAIWEISLEMIRKAPLGGVGLGNYKWNYMDAMADFSAKTTDAPPYTYWAHNEYLQWAAETGLPGLLLLLSLSGWAAFRCLRRLRQADDPALTWALAAMAVLAVDSCFSRPFHHVDTAFTFSLALALISRLALPPLPLKKGGRLLAGGVILAACVLGVYLFAEALPRQSYLGRYFYNDFYFSLVPSEEREKIRNPLLVRDAFQQLLARENAKRADIVLGGEDKDKTERDAIRALEGYFATQPRYEELNRLMLLYQKRGEFDRGEKYLKYYPPEERQKFREGRFEGKYMED